jgi:NarL family two-component system response regulator LiaR
MRAARLYIIHHRSVIVYGALMAILFLLLKWLEWKFLLVHHSFEIYVGLIALVFTALGVWLALKIVSPKTVIVEKVVQVHTADATSLDPAAAQDLGISDREMEVLALMAEGLSNEEIADRLFVSLNTIKTHNSNIFSKLDVKRRTQAVQKAKSLRLIA